MPESSENPALADARLHMEYGELLTRYLEAKEAHQAAPTDAAKAEVWREAKNEMREYRAYWRGVRRYVQDLAVAGDPEATARVIEEIGVGGAVAAPAPHGMGAMPTEV